MEDLEFRDIEKLVNYRLVTGLSEGMTEILEFTKIHLLNCSGNCIERLFKQGYLAMESTTKEELKESQEYICLETDDKSMFDSHLFLAKTRYLSGKTKGLKEIFTVLKMIITQDLSHSARRLESEGYVITVDPKYQKVETDNETNYGHAFDDILGEVYDPSEQND